MPVIGQFQISDIARVSFLLHEQWGKIVRLGGLLGRPDLLFVYDADEIEKVCLYRKISIRFVVFSLVANQRETKTDLLSNRRVTKTSFLNVQKKR